MTGPEHYRRAEALMAYVDFQTHHDLGGEGRTVESYQEDAENTVVMLQAAQVHATLALAAAQAEPVAAAYDGTDSAGARDMAKAWTEAIS